MMDGRLLCAWKYHHCFYVLGMVFVTLGHFTITGLDWRTRRKLKSPVPQA